MNEDFYLAMLQLEIAKEKNAEFFRKQDEERQEFIKQQNLDRQKYENNNAWVKYHESISSEFAEGEIERWYLSERYDEPRPKLKNE